MKFSCPSYRVLKVLFLILMFFLTNQSFSFAVRKDKQKNYVMTEIELQSELMSYADRFSSIISQAMEEKTAVRLQKYLVKLDRIEEKVSNIAVPLSFSGELYHLRMHIDMMRSKLKQLIEK